MKLIAPITDYIKGSLLTTRGDILTRGAAEAARLAIGSVGNILRVDSGGDDLEYQPLGQGILENLDIAVLASNTNITTASVNLMNITLGAMAQNEYALLIAGFFGQQITNSTWLKLELGSHAGTSGTFDFAGGGSSTFNHYMDVTVNNYYGASITALLKCNSAGTINIRLLGDVGANTFTCWGSGSTWLVGIPFRNV